MREDYLARASARRRPDFQAFILGYVIEQFDDLCEVAPTGFVVGCRFEYFLRFQTGKIYNDAVENRKVIVRADEAAQRRPWERDFAVGARFCSLAAEIHAYGWFTEGFDTRDLKEAKALLGELAV